MKLTDMLVSAIIKRGIVCESRNFETNLTIPESNITVNIKADNMTIRVLKEDEQEA